MKYRLMACLEFTTAGYGKGTASSQMTWRIGDYKWKWVAKLRGWSCVHIERACHETVVYKLFHEANT